MPIYDGIEEEQEDVVGTLAEDERYLIHHASSLAVVHINESRWSIDTDRETVGFPVKGGTSTLRVRVIKDGQRVGTPAPIVKSMPNGVTVEIGEILQNNERIFTFTSNGSMQGTGHKIVIGIDGNETVKKEIAVVLTP